jgi:hypothetical protein
MMYILNNVPLAPGQSFTVGEVQYPGNVLALWPAEDLTAIGVIWQEPPILTLAEAKGQRLEALADRRWQASQTFTYDGVRTQADPAIPAITAAVVSSQFLPPGTLRTWKLGTGEFRQWTINDIIAFGMAVSAYVQGCFNLEAVRAEAINDAPDLAALAAIDTETGWP